MLDNPPTRARGPNPFILVQRLSSSMRLPLLALAALAAGCVSLPVDDAWSATQGGEPPAPQATAAPAPVDPAAGEAEWHATGVCTRSGETLSCKGLAGGEVSHIRVAREGVLTVRFTWAAESPQTESMMVFVSDGDAYAKAEGPSPQVLEWEVRPGAYRLGAYPNAAVAAGTLKQTVAWTAELAGAG